LTRQSDAPRRWQCRSRPAENYLSLRHVPLPVRARLHLNHAIEFAINGCCYCMQWQGVGNLRCDARGYVNADSIHRKRSWKSEDIFLRRRGTNCFAIQQFEITFSNNLTDFGLAIFVHIDGRLVGGKTVGAGWNSKFLGPYKSALRHSILPLKFQELQLVGTFSSIFQTSPS
jgi:hypothetical protein